MRCSLAGLIITVALAVAILSTPLVFGAEQNMKTAKALGLTISQSILVQATDVIE